MLSPAHTKIPGHGNSVSPLHVQHLWEKSLSPGPLCPSQIFQVGSQKDPHSPHPHSILPQLAAGSTWSAVSVYTAHVSAIPLLLPATPRQPQIFKGTCTCWDTAPAAQPALPDRLGHSLPHAQWSHRRATLLEWEAGHHLGAPPWLCCSPCSGQKARHTFVLPTCVSCGDTETPQGAWSPMRRLVSMEEMCHKSWHCTGVSVASQNTEERQTACWGNQ